MDWFETSKSNELKNYFLISIVILIVRSSWEQKVNSPGSIDLVYTSKILKQNNFSSDINSFSNYNLLQPLNYVGINITSGFKITFGTREELTSGYLEIAKLIPQKVNIHDSIQATLHGYNLGIMIFGYDFIDKRKFDLITCLGFNLGRILIKESDDLKQKNPYLSPSLAIIPRYNSKKISIQFRFGYDFDISRKTWKSKGIQNPSSTQLNSLSFQGLNCTFGIGYLIE